MYREHSLGSKDVYKVLTFPYYDINSAVYVKKYYRGTYSAIVGTFKPVKDGNVQSLFCGFELNQSRSPKVSSWGVSYGIFSFSVADSYPSYAASRPAEPWKKYFYQWYSVDADSVTAHYTGDCHVILSNILGTVLSEYHQQLDEDVTFVCNDKGIGFVATTCAVKCCPTQELHDSP